MIRAVLFDLDGTLFDRATTVQRCIEGQYRRFAEILSQITPSEYISRFVELDARGYTTKDIVYGQIAAKYSLRHEDSTALHEDFFLHFHHHAIGFPGAIEVLRVLRSSGMSLGLITNGTGEHQKATLEALGAAALFDAILISEVEGIRKPDARIFERGLQRCGVSAPEAVFVGDHPEVDIAAARNAGLRTVWKRDPFWGEDCEADAVVDDLREIPDAVVALSQRS